MAESSKPTDPAAAPEGPPAIDESGVTDAPAAAGARPRRGSRPDAAKDAPAMQTPSVGRMVHFIVPKAMHGEETAAHRAAVISNVRNAKKGLVDLHVMMLPGDYPNNMHPGLFTFVEKVGYAEDESDGSWHWPEYV